MPIAPAGTTLGSGPIGLAALLTARFYAPANIIMVDLDDKRLAVARRRGASATVNSADGKAVEAVLALTGGRGVDAMIRAVGSPPHTLSDLRGGHRGGRRDCEQGRARVRDGSVSGEPVGSRHHNHHAPG